MGNSPERITKREAAEGEDARLAALIGGRLRVGTLEGVHVDFRHKELPADEWEALPWWPVWGEPPCNAGIVFPSEARVGIAKLREIKAMPEDRAAVYALPGDRISIERVEEVELGAEFDHPHDRFMRLAHLRIERPTGEVLHPPGPLGFYGVGSVHGHGSREAFDHIIERVLRHAGAKAFPRRAFDDFSSPWQLPLERAALFFAEQAHRNYQKLAAVLPKAGDPGGIATAYLNGLANNTALMGFLLSKIEAQEPTARARRQTANARTTAADRTPPALIKEAKRLAGENPKWLRGKISRTLDGHSGYDRRSIDRVLDRLNIGPPRRTKL